MSALARQPIFRCTSVISIWVPNGRFFSEMTYGVAHLSAISSCIAGIYEVTEPEIRELVQL